MDTRLLIFLDEPWVGVGPSAPERVSRSPLSRRVVTGRIAGTPACSLQSAPSPVDWNGRRSNRSAGPHIGVWSAARCREAKTSGQHPNDRPLRGIGEGNVDADWGTRCRLS